MLRGESIILEPLREEDAGILYSWITDRDLVVLSSRFDPPTQEDHRRWFGDVRRRPDTEIYGIRLVGEDRLVGTCQLHAIDVHHRNAQLQIRIGDRDAWGHGYGTEAVRLLVRHAFVDLQLHRVALHVFATNERAIKAYRKAGFEVEGCLRDAALIEGAYVDLLVMATLRS